MRHVAILAGALLAAGCVLGPDYRRPTVELPAQHRGAEASTSAATPAATSAPLADSAGAFGELGWWQLYRDPTLQALIRAALRNNPDASIAAARVEQAQALLGNAHLQRWPQLQAGAGGTRAQSSEFTRPASQDAVRTSWNLQLGVAYEIDLWGRLARLSESARAQWLAAEANRQATAAGLVATTASTWFTLAALDAQHATLRSSLGFRERFVELTRTRHDKGAASGLELASAEAQLAAAQAALADTERQRLQAENLLSTVVGQPPAAIARGAAVNTDLVQATLPPVDLPARLLERRPDLRAAEDALIAANAQVGAAQAARWPQLSLTGAFGAVSTDLSRLLSGDARAWSLGGNLLLPVLDAQRSGYAVDAAAARRREAEAQYRKTVLTALREVADALTERQQQAAALTAQQQQTTALTRARDIALARYRSGYSSYFEVINAERDLAAAQLQEIGARRGLQLAVLRLYLALGGGWSAEPR